MQGTKCPTNYEEVGKCEKSETFKVSEKERNMTLFSVGLVLTGSVTAAVFVLIFIKIYQYRQ